VDGLTSLEICAGAGAQALGLAQAGFVHAAVVELDPNACETLRLNRGAAWKIIEGDIHDQDGRGFSGIDLLAGGIPCPPFSIAGKQLGAGDDRDLFPSALRLVREARPRAVLLENVRGLAARRFDGYRIQVLTTLRVLGYQTWWRQIQASEHEVPQLRPRFVLVAIRRPWSARFSWPAPSSRRPPTVGGSKKHGGPDLGPTRARQAWAALGVDGLGVADHPPGPDFPPSQPPKLTVAMVSRLQGFPDGWSFSGRKTAAYRQVGNAFPPPVARALGTAIRQALEG
jgi:DNA (cytosine-5)-methyltransferase 1